MLAMYTRRLTLPPRPFLLLGPRGTGKTTWLRRHLSQAQWYNLLLDRELLRLMREPGAFRREIEALPKGAWARAGAPGGQGEGGGTPELLLVGLRRASGARAPAARAARCRRARDAAG